VKVIDFGFARLFPKDSPTGHSLNARGSLVGTPEFMAPEQARDVHAVDIRSDIYSLGCTFYFVMSGVLPFSGETPLDTLLAHVGSPPRPLVAFCPQVPAPVSSIVERMMARNPSDRFQTPEELATALTFAIGGLSADRVSPSPVAVLQSKSETPSVRDEASVE